VTCTALWEGNSLPIARVRIRTNCGGLMSCFLTSCIHATLQLYMFGIHVNNFNVQNSGHHFIRRQVLAVLFFFCLARFTYSSLSTCNFLPALILHYVSSSTCCSPSPLTVQSPEMFEWTLRTVPKLQMYFSKLTEPLGPELFIETASLQDFSQKLFATGCVGFPAPQFRPPSVF
jgi:hypothetical protein